MSGKLSLSAVPPEALRALARAMMDGRAKYGLADWRSRPVSALEHWDGAQRHLLAWLDGEDRAPDSGVDHLGHAMGRLAVLIDARACGVLVDDRPAEAASAIATSGRFDRIYATCKTWLAGISPSFSRSPSRSEPRPSRPSRRTGRPGACG